MEKTFIRFFRDKYWTETDQSDVRLGERQEKGVGLRLGGLFVELYTAS